MALVHRTTRSVTLTDAGTTLVRRARRVLAELEAAEGELQDLRGVLGGRVALGVTPTPGPVDVAALAAAFHARHPSVDLTLREDLSTTLADLLRADALDLALLTAIDEREREGLELEPLAAEPLVLAVAADHRLAERGASGPRRDGHPAAARPVAIDDLRDERFVSFRRGATIRRRVDRAAAAAAFEPRIAFESDELERVRAMVGHGLGVAVLPDSDARRGDAPIRAIALADPAMVHELFLAWRAGRRHSPAANALLELARDVGGD